MDTDALNQKKDIVLSFISSEEYVPLKFKEMAMVLGVPGKERGDLREVISNLENEGKIMVDSKGKIRLPDEHVKTGTYLGSTKGFGFVSVEGEEDIYISESDTKSALHGDLVLVSIIDSKKGRRREGEILRIIERKSDTIVGTFTKSKNFGFVISDNKKLGKDIYIPKTKDKGAVSGHKVVVKITDFGSQEKNPEGAVLEILGHYNDPGVDILSIIKAYGLPEEFSKEVMKQVENIPDEVAEEDKAGRMDIRSLQTVTIDGEDAKDLDDAITLEKKEDKFILGVHIADVTNYVTENSPLDKEAVERGTSVYLVDRVIPMLPHRLSNGICSLNAGEDRLSLGCFIEIDFEGKILSHKIVETVLRVDERMTYTDVNKILTEHEPECMERYHDFIEIFENMKQLAHILRKNRKKHGSIDFDFPESKIILDREGHPISIKAYDRNVATKIIEEFMLIANQVIAEDYFWLEIPFVYRTHEYPNPEKIQQLSSFVSSFGYHLRSNNGEIHPKEIQKLIEMIDGKPEEALISRLTLRSMKRAKYSTINEGHFGLATQYYCHFTSPIRRYPDLQIHRIIKENLHGKISEKRSNHYEKLLPGVAKAASDLERRADEAEREVDKLKKTEYMADHIGEEFEGIISGVTNWGIYVELPNTIEGMIRLADLSDDFYHYDEGAYSVVGEHHKKVFKLGDQIRVEVARVDKETRTIDFLLAMEEGDILESGEE